MTVVARLDRKLAEATLSAIREQFGEYLQPVTLVEAAEVLPADPGPVLREDWDGDGNWAIVWESGPDEWAFRAFQGGVDPEVFESVLPDVRAVFPHISDAEARKRARKIATNRAVACPRGVYAEPYYSFVLMVYRAD